MLPVAAIEQHGPHLPVSVDTTLVNGVVEASLAHLPADLPVLFLPTQQVGKSNEHIRFPGTLTLSAQTTIAVWMELGGVPAAYGLVAEQVGKSGSARSTAGLAASRS